MSFATFSFLWMLIFHSYFNPELPPATNNSTDTNLTATEGPGAEITTIPATITGIPHMSTTSKPEKPPYTVPGLIFGSGSGGAENIGASGSNCGSLTLNEEESSQASGYQEESYYKRWECLWPETQCQRMSARRYCARGCLAKFSTVTTKCYDGCCRCLIFTSESPTPENQQYYSF